MSKTEKPKSVPVASLKSLAGAAPEFLLPVKIKRLDGEDVTINFTAKALRKKEWAALRDSFAAPIEAQTPEEDAPAPKFTYTAAVAGDMDKGAGLVLQFASGWDLEDAFNAAALVEMEDQFGGSIATVLQAYDLAIFHGRLGN